MQPILEKGKGSSEYRIAQLGIGAGAVLQVANEVVSIFDSNRVETRDMVSMLARDIQPDDIVKFSNDLKGQGESYIGAILALVMSIVYIGKRAVLKYFELKGQIAIEVAKINAEVEAIKAGYVKQLKSESEKVENPNERTDLIIP